MDRALEDHIALASCRADTYTLLARLFDREIDQDFWDLLGNLASDQHLYSEDEGYSLLAHYVGQAPSDPLTDLAVDYASTFLGVGPTCEGAFPYESAYTSEDGLLMQEARDEMIALLDAEGLAANSSERYREDHVATELGYLAHLAAKTRSSLESGDAPEADAAEGRYAAFLKERALPWVPSFCSDVQRLARTDFYRGAALTTQRFLAFDAKACV